MKVLIALLVLYVVLDIAFSVGIVIVALRNGYTLRELAFMLRSVFSPKEDYDDWGDNDEEFTDYEDVTDDTTFDDGYIVEESNGSDN